MTESPFDLPQDLATARGTDVPATSLTPRQDRISRIADHHTHGPAHAFRAHANAAEVLEEYFKLHALLAQPLTDQLAAQSGSMKDLAVLMPLVAELCKVGKNICQIKRTLGPHRREARAAAQQAGDSTGKRRFVEMIPNGAALE